MRDLRERRKLAGWNLWALAKASKVDVGTLSRAENGWVKLSPQQELQVLRVLDAELKRRAQRIGELTSRNRRGFTVLAAPPA